MKPPFSLLAHAARVAALLFAAASLIPAARAQVTIDGINYGSTRTLNGTSQTSSSFTSVGNSSYEETLNVLNGGSFQAVHDVTVGNTGSGTTNVTATGTINVGGHFVVGSELSSMGTVTVSGLGSQVNVAGDFTAVGLHGVGIMYVQNNASFQQSAGLLTVASETGSFGLFDVWTGSQVSLHDFISGGHGIGSTYVNTDSTLNVSNWLGVGFDAPSHGSLTIGNAGSSVHANSAAIGVFGQGAVNVNTGGALVVNDALSIGQQSTGLGTVLVDGAGTTVNVGNYLGVGQVGTGELTIRNGGFLHTSGYMGVGQNAGSEGSVMVQSGGALVAGQELHLGEGNGGSSAGTLTVTGAGSSVQVDQTLIVGQWGTGTLTVQNGGAVAARDFNIAAQTGSSGSVTISGTGSTVSAAGNAYLGAASSGALTVENGGAFHAANWSSLGIDGGGTLDVRTGGSATFGADLILGHNATGQGTLNLHDAGSSVTVGGALSVGRGGTGTVNLSDGASLQVNGWATLAGDQAGSSGTINVNGAGSTVASNQLLVGWQGNGNLHLTNGGEAHSNNQLTVGWQGAGTVSVDGPGSKLSASGYTSLGDMGTASMTLTNGADFTAGNTVVLGLNTTGQATLEVKGGSTVTTALDAQVGWQGTGTLKVDGPGSSLQVTNGGLFAGWKGTGTIDVTNGGAINTNGWASIADQAGSHGAMTVDGPGSQFNLTGGMTVGNLGTGTLDITHGGTINTTGWGTQVGGAAGSSGTVTVDGTGSSWTNSGDLLLGWGGTGSLAVSNGGTFSTHVLTVGGDFSSGIGHGTLSISSGGTVNSLDGLLGNSSGSSGTATVDGAGSAWHISNDLEVGLSGTGATGALAITNGGAVTAGWYMGVGINGNLGAVTVDGPGSSLNLLGGMDLGGGSPGSPGVGTLAITHGGSVSINYSNIGGSDGSVGSVTVDGAGSSWTVAGDLRVGTAGNGSLNVTNGAMVISASSAGYTTSIGNQAGSIGAVTVDGAGSSWTIADQLIVGDTGTGSLAITHGGAVTATALTVAANAGSSGTVTIDGGNLNAAAITIGTTGTLDFSHSGAAAGSLNAATIDNAGTFNINTAANDARTLGADLHNAATGTTRVRLQDNATVTITGAVVNDGLFKVTQEPGTGGGMTTFTGTFTNNGTFIQDPTTTHFQELQNLGAFYAGYGDHIIVDHGLTNGASGIFSLSGSTLTSLEGVHNDGLFDIHDSASLFGDYAGSGDLVFHVDSLDDSLNLNGWFNGRLTLDLLTGFSAGSGASFLRFAHGANLSDFIIGDTHFGPLDFAGPGFLTTDGVFHSTASVPDEGSTLLCLSLGCAALAWQRRRFAAATQASLARGSR